MYESAANELTTMLFSKLDILSTWPEQGGKSRILASSIADPKYKKKIPKHIVAELPLCIRRGYMMTAYARERSDSVSLTVRLVEAVNPMQAIYLLEQSSKDPKKLNTGARYRHVHDYYMLQNAALGFLVAEQSLSITLRPWDIYDDDRKGQQTLETKYDMKTLITSVNLLALSGGATGESKQFLLWGVMNAALTYSLPLRRMCKVFTPAWYAEFTKRLAVPSDVKVRRDHARFKKVYQEIEEDSGTKPLEVSRLEALTTMKNMDALVFTDRTDPVSKVTAWAVSDALNSYRRNIYTGEYMDEEEEEAPF